MQTTLYSFDNYCCRTYSTEFHRNLLISYGNETCLHTDKAHSSLAAITYFIQKPTGTTSEKVWIYVHTWVLYHEWIRGIRAPHPRKEHRRQSFDGHICSEVPLPDFYNFVFAFDTFFCIYNTEVRVEYFKWSSTRRREYGWSALHRPTAVILRGRDGFTRRLPFPSFRLQQRAPHLRQARLFNEWTWQEAG
jgi:hypothetical protein